MQEIFQQLKEKSELESKAITLLNNPQQYLGITITHCHRIIYFENQDSSTSFYIDFLKQDIAADKLYIVPSGHLTYIPFSTKNYHCFMIPETLISDFEKCWIYKFKYQSDKSIRFSIPEIKVLQKKFITQFFESNVFATKANSCSSLYHAEQLCDLLLHTQFTHNVTVADLSKKLCITQSILWRVCSRVFYCKPQTIVRYHLLLKITYCLIANRQISIHEIALDLGFKDVTTFCRFIKVATQHSPTEIRNKYKHI